MAKAFLPVRRFSRSLKRRRLGARARHRIPLATLRRALAGQKVRQSTRARLAELAASLACEELRAANPGLALPYDPEQVCQIYRRSLASSWRASVEAAETSSREAEALVF